MPFVRQQADLHGPEVNLDFPHFMAMLPGKVVGEVLPQFEPLLPYLTGRHAEADEPAPDRVKDASKLASAILRRAGTVTFGEWGDRPLNVSELTAVLLEEM